MTEHTNPETLEIPFRTLGAAFADYAGRHPDKTAIHAIDQLNPTLNAVVIKNFENASTSIRDGLVTGPLAGVPFLVKDVNVFTSDISPKMTSLTLKRNTLPSLNSREIL